MSALKRYMESLLLTCKFFNPAEKHRRKTRYIEYDIGKVFLMRIANVLGVYLTKFLTEQSVVDDEELCEDADEGPDCECPLAPMGQQFFWIVSRNVIPKHLNILFYSFLSSNPVNL